MPRGVTGAPGVPELVLPPEESLEEAQRLLDAGRAFHAHEVLEGTWKAAVAKERELWRGLAQIAVGLTHVQRGNQVGAIRLLRRAADRVEGYAAEPPYGINAAGLVEWTRALAARIERDGLAGIGAADLVPQLLRN